MKGDLSPRSSAHPAARPTVCGCDSVRVGGWRRRVGPPDETTPSDVAYFRALVARLAAGGDDLWDLPCARLALAAIERRYEEIRACRAGNEEAARLGRR